ncbi:MAG: ABC transporter permease subunit [Firmicutes bacterium]|nr:ABC transporter permease subunit [Bacillota bacterium]
MKMALEFTKIKRTGLLPAFLCGGLLASMIPVLNMAVRSEAYVNLSQPPLDILLDGNWQTMAMLNLLLAVIGACLVYHTEFADNAMEKMRTLPIGEGRMFLGKTLVLACMCIVVLIIETAALAACGAIWFESGDIVWPDLMRNAGCMLLLLLPAVILSLLVASLCENMWISFGIGVLGVFIATMMPSENFALSLFPFALHFHVLGEKTAELGVGAAVEILALVAAGAVIQKIRRRF